MKVLLMHWDTPEGEKCSISRNEECLERGIDRLKEDELEWWTDGESREVHVRYGGLIDLVEINDLVFLEKDEIYHIKFPH